MPTTCGIKNSNDMKTALKCHLRVASDESQAIGPNTEKEERLERAIGEKDQFKALLKHSHSQEENEP